MNASWWFNKKVYLLRISFACLCWLGLGLACIGPAAATEPWREITRAHRPTKTKPPTGTAPPSKTSLSHPKPTRKPSQPATQTNLPTVREEPSLTHTPTATLTAASSPTATASAVITLLPTATASLTPMPANGRVAGYSVQGRPLEVYQFGSGATKRLVIAGIHGGWEYNTIALADQMRDYLAQHPEAIPEQTTLYILRSLNPDGEARGRDIYSRANENLVDLNRNFPALWQADWDRTGCWSYLRLSGGSGPGSEPETQAVMKFVTDFEIDGLINYHSAALGIFPGGQPPDPKSESLAAAVAAVSDYPYPPIDTGCRYSGQLIDWASLNGVAALDIELTTQYETDWEQNLRILTAFLAWQPEAP